MYVTPGWQSETLPFKGLRTLNTKALTIANGNRLAMNNSGYLYTF